MERIIKLRSLVEVELLGIGGGEEADSDAFVGKDLLFVMVAATGSCSGRCCGVAFCMLMDEEDLFINCWHRGARLLLMGLNAEMLDSLLTMRNAWFFLGCGLYSSAKHASVSTFSSANSCSNIMGSSGANNGCCC